MTRKKARFFGSPKNLQEKTDSFLIQRTKYINEEKVWFSLDETSFGRNGKQMMGYAPKGHQLRIKRNQPSMKTISSLVIASQNGIFKQKEYVGSYNTELFMSFLNELNLPNNSVILLDNVSFHHSKQVKEWASRNNICLLFTPPYSPWYNPIEGVFSIVKRSFYKHGDIEEAFATVQNQHCSAFFNKSFSDNPF